MKHFCLALLLATIIPTVCLASDALPFPVRVGGQRARDGVPYATIDNPVAADAEVAVDTTRGMTFINLQPVTAQGEFVPGSLPQVIFVDGNATTRLIDTSDHQRRIPFLRYTSAYALHSGRYLMTVVSNGKTANVLLTIR